MSYFVNTLSIQRWAGSANARLMLPHVIRKLIHATVERKQLQKVHFPAYESGQRPGFDGEVICTMGNSWVPLGQSVWELSVHGKTASKAGGDFEKRTMNTAAAIRKQSTYVCVSARKWQNKKAWEDSQRKLKKWKDVRAFDADDLEQWMEVAPSVATWFSLEIGDRPPDVDDASHRWESIASSTKQPLSPEVFLANRSSSQQRIRDWLNGEACELIIESRSPGEVIDFVCAHFQTLDEDAKIEALARSVIIESLSAWKILRDNSFPAVLLIEPNVQISAEEIGRAIARGHHVLLACEPRSLDAANIGMLERPSEFQLSQALESCGLTPVQSEQYARNCGSSLAVLKRMLGRIRPRHAVSWESLASDRAIVTALLLGGWDGRNAADRVVIENLAGASYSELESEFQRLESCPDPMIFSAAGKWRLLSKEEAWFVLGDLVASSDLEAFRNVAVQVLLDDDPRFEMDIGENLYIQLTKSDPHLSGTLKTHVAHTIAFLGAFGNRLSASSKIPIGETIDRIVQEVLKPTSTWQRWASLGSRLTLLAEASPNVFLRAVREDLARADPELVKLLHDDGNPLFNPCKHAGLLWALETLAWSREHLPEVSQALLRLTENDPGGQWSNRPSVSFCEIFSFWMPHTTATVAERIQLIDLQIARVPETAWKVLLQLLPQAGGVSMPTHRPMWRDWANDWVRGASNIDAAHFAEGIGTRVIEQAGLSAARWKAVLENLSRFPDSLHQNIAAGVDRLAKSDLSDLDRQVVSTELSEQVNRHRYFSGAAWSLPNDVLASLESCISQLRPKDVVLQHIWLFEQHPDRFFERKDGTYQEHERALEKARDDAFSEIVNSLGFEGAEALIAKAGAPFIVGVVAARTTGDQFLAKIIPIQYGAGDKSLNFAGGYVAARFSSDGWNWADSALERCESAEDRGWFLISLPFDAETWNRVEQSGKAKAHYWKNCSTWVSNLDGDDLRLAVDMLIAYGRTSNAIDLLAMAIHGKKQIASETILKPLEHLLSLEGSEGLVQAQKCNADDIRELIQELQNRNDFDEDRLSRIEWNFLGVLRDHFGHAPKTLHRRLCESPAFFVEVLTLLYRSIDEETSDSGETEVDSSRSALMAQSWKLLRDWKQLPGTDANGAIDEVAIQKWCNETRQLASNCGRLEPCDSHLGQLFAHSSPESDGRWPCAIVTKLIEDIASDAIGSGFATGVRSLHGSGFHGNNGEQERELAESYRKKANAIRFEAPFTARVLDSVVSYFEAWARDWDERGRWEA